MGATAVAVENRRIVVVADESGLLVRNRREGTRRLAWDDIEDFRLGGTAEDAAIYALLRRGGAVVRLDATRPVWLPTKATVNRLLRYQQQLRAWLPDTADG